MRLLCSIHDDLLNKLRVVIRSLSTILGSCSELSKAISMSDICSTQMFLTLDPRFKAILAAILQVLRSFSSSIELFALDLVAVYEYLQ